MSDPITKLSFSPQGIAFLQMADAAGGNRLSAKLVGGFLDALAACRSDTGLRVLVISGLPEVFCAGATKEHLLELAEGKFSVRDLLIPEHLVDMPIPVIAACEGHAVGGGLAIAACCDMVILARESRYGAVFMNLGFTPGMGCTGLLPRLFGECVANEMMYSGRLFKGRDLADRASLVNAIVPRGEVIEAARLLARRIAEKSPDTLRLLKATLGKDKQERLAAARTREDAMHRACFSMPGIKERITSAYDG